MTTLLHDHSLPDHCIEAGMEGGSVGGRKCGREAKMELRGEDIRKQVKGANMACSIIIL